MTPIERQLQELFRTNLPIEQLFPKEEQAAIRRFIEKTNAFAEMMEKKDGIPIEGFIKTSLDIVSLSDQSEKVQEQILKSVMRADEEVIGKFLVAHLKIEYIINMLLRENMRETDKKSNGAVEYVDYIDRIKLLPTEGKAYTRVINLIHELRKLRNKLAHKIYFDFDSHHSPEIDKYLNPYFNETKQGKTKIENIIDVINYVCFLLLLETNEMKETKQKIIHDNPQLRLLLFGQ